jgi:ADP-ribosylation factor-like protein 2
VDYETRQWGVRWARPFKFIEDSLPRSTFSSKKFNGEETSTIEPTLGFNIKTLEYQGYLLNVWDVGGQQTIRSYWRNYFEATDGLIWVVDSADRRRLEVCRQELHALLQQEKLAGASLLVFANKQDLQGAPSPGEIALTLGLEDEAFAKGRHWTIVGCSAMTGDGLEHGVGWMVRDIASRIFMLN